MQEERSLLNSEPAPEPAVEETGGAKIDFDDEWFKPFKTFRIAVSGDVELNKFETSIVDTREFQRLRSIKQLGTTYLIYPTAVHTRFDHSLGTLKMARRMVECIKNNKHNTDEERAIAGDELQLVRLYALLHDIGHIPFGHSLEDEYNLFPPHDKDGERIRYFLGEDSTIGGMVIDRLGKDFYKRLMGLYRAKGKKKLNELGDDLFIYDIVNNTVCADLLDYLQRDSYFCNIELGMDYRFLKYLYLAPYKKGARRLLIRLWKGRKRWPKRDIITELIRLLDNRYLIAERVYFHHAKRIAGAMVASAVLRVRKAGELSRKDMWRIGDETLLDRLEASTDKAASRLASAIRERHLWEEVYRINKEGVKLMQSFAFDVDFQKFIERTFHDDPHRRAELEDEISGLAEINPGDVLISCPKPDMSLKPAEMKFYWKGDFKLLKECVDDPVIKAKLEGIEAAHKSLWEMRCYYNTKCGKPKASVKEPCEVVLTLSLQGEQEPGVQEKYWKMKVAQYTAEKGYDNIDHLEYVTRQEKAVENLVRNERSVDSKTFEGIVDDAFAS